MLGVAGAWIPAGGKQNSRRQIFILGAPARTGVPVVLVSLRHEPKGHKFLQPRENRSHPLKFNQYYTHCYNDFVSWGNV